MFRVGTSFVKSNKNALRTNICVKLVHKLLSNTRSRINLKPISTAYPSFLNFFTQFKPVNSRSIVTITEISRLDTDEEIKYWWQIVQSEINRLNYGDALEAINKVLEFSPDNIHFISCKIQILLQLKLFDQAKNYLNECLKKDPQNSDIQKLFANIYNIEGKPEKELEVYCKVVESNPHDKDAWEMLLMRYHVLGKFEEEWIAAKQALVFLPNFSQAWIALARICGQKKMHEEASMFYQKALIEDPENGFYLQEYFINLAILKRDIEAIQVAEKIFAICDEPTFGDLFLLSNIYYSQHNYLASYDTIQIALKCIPETGFEADKLKIMKLEAKVLYRIHYQDLLINKDENTSEPFKAYPTTNPILNSENLEKKEIISITIKTPSMILSELEKLVRCLTETDPTDTEMWFIQASLHVHAERWADAREVLFQKIPFTKFHPDTELEERLIVMRLTTLQKDKNPGDFLAYCKFLLEIFESFHNEKHRICREILATQYQTLKLEHPNFKPTIDPYYLYFDDAKEVPRDITDDIKFVNLEQYTFFETIRYKIQVSPFAKSDITILDSVISSTSNYIYHHHIICPTILNLLIDGYLNALINSEMFEEVINFLNRHFITLSSLSQKIFLLNMISQAYIRMEMYLESLPYLRVGKLLDPLNNRFDLNFAVVSYSLGNKSRALEIYESLLEKDPNDLEATKGKINCLPPEEGHGLLNSKFHLFHEDPDIFAFKGIFENNQNNYQQSLEWFDKALTINPQMKISKIGKARVLIATDRLLEAQEILEQSLSESKRKQCPEVWHLIAQIKYKQGDLRSGLEAAKNCLKSEPDNFDVLILYISIIYKHLEIVDKGTEEYLQMKTLFSDVLRKIVELRPEDENTVMYQFLDSLRNGDWISAKDHLENFRRICPNSFEVEKFEATLMLKSGQIDDSLELTEKLIKNLGINDFKSDNHYQLFCIKLAALQELKRFDAALAFSKNFLKFFPDNFEIIDTITDILIKCSREKEALHFLTKEMHHHPEWSNLYYNRALVYLNIKKNEDALEDINKAIEISSLNPNYMLLKFEIMLEKNPKEALDIILKYPSIFGSDEKYNHHAFISAFKAEEFDLCLKFLDPLIKKDPENINYLSAKANSLLMKEAYLDAVDVCDCALKIRPNDVSLSTFKSSALIALGRYGEARMMIELLNKNAPQFFWGFHLRALVDYYSGNVDSSLIIQNAANSLDPQNPRGLNNLACYYYLLDKLDYAIENIEKAIEIDPSLKETWLNRGKIFEKIDLNESKKSLEHANRLKFIKNKISIILL